MRFVRNHHGLLELEQTITVETEIVGSSVELRSFLGRDDPILEGFCKQLLVLCAHRT